MKNIKIIFILLSLIAFSPCAVAQTPKKDTTKKFLRAKKHLNSVAKETQKLERTLSEPELKKPVKDVKVPVEETTVLTAPENEPSVAKEIILEEKNPDELKAEQQMEKTEKRSPRGWLLSAEANTNMGMIRANDSFGRQLKLVSSLGFGGYASIGYRFDRYIAIVGD